MLARDAVTGDASTPVGVEAGGGGGGGGGEGPPDPAPLPAAGVQPSASLSVRSFAVIALSTLEFEYASNELAPTDEAQSPESPPATVLNAPRLVTPPFGEKYPAVEAERSRAPAEE